MCGIFAMFLRRPLTDADVDLGRRATAALRHRGPDASGEWVDRASGVYLGHRRLSIIDLSAASNQPMRLGNLAITYNGEIYNYRVLRDRLKGLGHSFLTTGDTEVLLHAWQQLGEKALDDVDGMLGFALWDGAEGWVAVDRYAEKQVYVASVDDGLLVASELTTLARAAGIRANLVPEQVAAFLSLGYIPGPTTAYPGIRRMSPAGILRIRNGAIIEDRRTWRPPFGEPGRGPIEPVDERGLDRIQAALRESVARRLESDAPTCVYLSSGVDSSLIAAIAAKDLGRALETFTVSFPRGNSHDESGDAGAIAAHLGVPHRVVESSDEPDAVSPEFFFELLGQPSDDLTLAALYQMARVGAGLGYKVGLTGLGGDEVVFGYNKHAFAYHHRRLLNAPAWLRIAGGAALTPLAGISSRARTFRLIAGVPDCERYVALKNFPSGSALRGVPGFDDWTARFFAPTTRPIEYAIPIFEFEGVMTEHRLPSTDTGSMRAGIEFRTPYLSRTLQETVASLDPRALLRFGQKSVLRRLLSRYISDPRLVSLPKRGFVFPSDRFSSVTLQQVPEVSMLPKSLVSEIWRKRSEPGWRGLATRTSMLAAFQHWSPGGPESLRPVAPPVALAAAGAR